jgi:hypothetical protein
VKGETDPLLPKLGLEKPHALQFYFWLFNGIFYSWNYMRLNDRMTVNNELEITWNK